VNVLLPRRGGGGGEEGREREERREEGGREGGGRRGSEAGCAQAHILAARLSGTKIWAFTATIISRCGMGPLRLLFFCLLNIRLSLPASHRVQAQAATNGNVDMKTLHGTLLLLLPGLEAVDQARRGLTIELERRRRHWRGGRWTRGRRNDLA